MPLIPEEHYIDVSKIVNNNFDQLSNEQKTGFAQVLQNYRDQQKELGLPLTPKLDSGEYQAQKDSNDFFKNVYSGVKNIPIPPAANDFFSTDDAKFKLANKEYLGHFYNKNINDDDEYETFKNGFVNDNKLTDSSELNLYNFVQKNIQDQSFVADKVKNSRQNAQEAVNNDENLNDSLGKIQTSKGSDAVYIPEYTDTFNHVKGVVDSYRSDINNFTDAMTKKMTTGETPEDASTIKSFASKLVEMPDDHRDTVLSYLHSVAKRKGVKQAELFNNVANEFADSFGRIFSQGFAGASSKQIELGLAGIPVEGKVITDIPNIWSKEDAQKFINDKLMNFYAEKSGQVQIADPTMVVQKGTLRELTSEETAFIKEAKDDLQKGVDISRSIRDVGQSLDPVRDNWKGYMASATGGSLALLGTAAIPGGVVINQQMYSGANYDELRTQYPNMNPANAALVGDVAGVFEAGMDQLNLSFLKNLPGLAGFLTPGKSVASKILRGTGAAVGSYVFENVIEGGQDLSKPIAQTLLQTIAKDIPSVDWQKEWGDWYATRPQVAIGMIPLSIFGLAAGTSNKIYNDKALLKTFSNDDIFQKYGITEDNRIVIRKLVADKDADGLRSALSNIQNQRDVNYSNAQANRMTDSASDISNIINSNDLMDYAVNQGIVPKYVFNRTTNKYDAVVNNTVQATGLEKNELGEHQQNYIKGNLDNSINFINNFIANKPIDKATTLTSSQIINKHNTIAKLNGLDNDSINEINNAFGNSLNQKDIMLKLANSLKDADPTAKNAVLVQYINSIFKNLSKDVQDTLGNNTLEARANLKNLILNKVSNMVTSKPDSLLFNGISPNDASITTTQKSALNSLQKHINKRNIATQLLISTPNMEFHTTKGISNRANLHTIVNQLKDLFGVDVLLFQTSNNAEIGIEGMFDADSNTIFLNSQNKNPFLFLMGHEFGHFIEKNHPELHSQLKETILASMSSEQKDAYFQVLKESSSSYNTEAKLEAELVSDYLGHRMLSEDFLNKLLFKDESLFKTFVTTVKTYITNLKNKIVGKRDISNFITKPLDNADAMLAKILKEISGNKTLVAARGHQSFFEDNKENNAKKINLLANRIRDIFNSAAQMSQSDVTGLTEEQQNATLDQFITPVDDKAFQTAFNEASTAINTKVANKYQNALDGRPTSTETLLDGTEIEVPEQDEDADAYKERMEAYKTAYDKTNEEFSKYREGLHQRLGLLNGARLTDTYNESVMAVALAAINTNKTLDEVNNLTEAEKAVIVKKAVSEIDNKLIENYKQSINNYINYYKGSIDPKLVNNLRILNTVQKALNSTNPLAESNLLLKDLYTDNGVPNLKEGNFADKLFQYNALRYLGNTGEKSGNQYQQINKFLQGLNVNKSISFFLEDELPGLLKSAQAELSQNDTVINNKTAKNKKVLQETKHRITRWIADNKKSISSYMDNHLTFASLLEYAFPNQNKTTIDQTLVDELNTLSALTNPTQDDLNRIETLKNQVNIGKALTPTIQKMSDDINNGFLQAQLDNNENENSLLLLVGKELGKNTQNINELNILNSKNINDLTDEDKLRINELKKIISGQNFSFTPSEVRQRIFELSNISDNLEIEIQLDPTKSIKSKFKLSPAYAAYILNISDQQKYQDQLTNKGFTPDIIKTIKNKLETNYKDVNELRKGLRKLIQKENEKTNDEYTRIYGLGVPTPNANFYPVRYKNRNIAVISPYDNSYQSGTMNKFLDNSTDQVEEELDLNPVEQGDNIISMYYDHMVQSSHKRNLYGPLLVAKQILTDKTISDKLENAFGKSYKELLFKQLAAFETNGIRSNFLDFRATNWLRKSTTNVARGAMGYRMSTMLVNFTSGLNATMDTSIPAWQVAKSYSKVLGLGIFSKKNVYFGKDTAFQSKQIQDRITMGANSLIAMSKANSFADDPGGLLKETARRSLSPMSYFDALGGAIAAAAAYDAHYSMAENAGITDPKILNDLATEGMARTINKTFQPIILSGKASFEMDANPMLKILTLFMSETRKTLGLELTTIKTKGFKSGETYRMLFANHVLLGLASWVVRSGMSALFGPPKKEDEDNFDPSKLTTNILLGPLNGFFLAGTALEIAAYQIHNILIDSTDSDDKKLPVFKDGNVIAESISDATLALKLLDPEKREESSNSSIAGDIDSAIRAVSTLTGTSGGYSTISNMMKQLSNLFSEE